MTKNSRWLALLSLNLLITSVVLMPSQVQAETTIPLAQEERDFFDWLSTLTEDQVKEFETMGKEFEAELDKLPPAEKAKFEQELEQFAQELAPKMESYFKEQEAQVKPAEKLEPQKPEVQPDHKKKNKKSKDKTTDQKKKPTVAATPAQAATLVTNITHAITSFLDTAQAHADFSKQIQEWTCAEQLPKWRSGLTWNFFKDQVETLKQKLELLNTQDENSNYVHLDALVQDTNLYEHLTQLERTLTESTASLKETVANLYKAINTVHITGLINTVLTKK